MLFSFGASAFFFYKKKIKRIDVSQYSIISTLRPSLGSPGRKAENSVYQYLDKAAHIGNLFLLSKLSMLKYSLNLRLISIEEPT